MSMKNGSLSLRVFYSMREIGREPLAIMMDEKAPAPESVGQDGVSYWVDVHELAGYNVATLRFAFRKVPKAQLDAGMKKEIETYERAMNGKANRKIRADLRADLLKALLPTMPIQTRDTELVWKTGDHFLYTTATSETAASRLQNRWLLATQLPLLWLGVDDLVKLEAGVDIREAPPRPLSPDATVLPPDATEHAAEFLTWAWARLESGTRIDGKAGMVEPPLLLLGGRDAGIVRVDGPQATVATEVAKALESGKLLHRAKFVLDMSDELPMSMTLDPSLILRSIALPKGEERDPAGSFQERMTRVEATWDWLRAAVRQYGEIRSHERWADETAQIRRWISGKVGRAKSKEG